MYVIFCVMLFMLCDQLIMKLFANIFLIKKKWKYVSIVVS